VGNQAGLSPGLAWEDEKLKLLTFLLAVLTGLGYLFLHDHADAWRYDEP
jgi:hypothetical protein